MFVTHIFFRDPLGDELCRWGELGMEGVNKRPLHMAANSWGNWGYNAIFSGFNSTYNC